MLQCTMKTIITIDFLVQQNYIIKTRCINKNKPQLHCNGKCYLKKKLNAENNQEQQLPMILKEKFQPSILVVVNNIEFTRNDEKLIYANGYILTIYEPPIAKIFHPPRIKNSKETILLI